jgi:hypothetical protein
MARLRLLPTLWFRNTWSWGVDDRKPLLRAEGPGVIRVAHHELGDYRLYCDGDPELLFTENETNTQRLWGQPNGSAYVKDAFHAYVISGQHSAVNPGQVGTKAAAHYMLEVPAGGSKTVRLRLTALQSRNAFADFEPAFERRAAEADEFYNRITPQSLTEDERRVHRQALAGITSAYSTAARNCPPADRWSRRTAPRGWPFTASACWRWLSSFANTTPCTKKSRTSSPSSTY